MESKMHRPLPAQTQRTCCARIQRAPAMQLRCTQVARPRKRLRAQRIQQQRQASKPRLQTRPRRDTAVRASRGYSPLPTRHFPTNVGVKRKPQALSGGSRVVAEPRELGECAATWITTGRACDTLVRFVCRSPPSPAERPRRKKNRVLEAIKSLEHEEAAERDNDDGQSAEVTPRPGKKPGVLRWSTEELQSVADGLLHLDDLKDNEECWSKADEARRRFLVAKYPNDPRFNYLRGWEAVRQYLRNSINYLTNEKPPTGSSGPSSIAVKLRAISDKFQGGDGERGAKVNPLLAHILARQEDDDEPAQVVVGSAAVAEGVPSPAAIALDAAVAPPFSAPPMVLDDNSPSPSEAGTPATLVASSAAASAARPAARPAVSLAPSAFATSAAAASRGPTPPTVKPRLGGLPPNVAAGKGAYNTSARMRSLDATMSEACDSLIAVSQQRQATEAANSARFTTVVGTVTDALASAGSAAARFGEGYLTLTAQMNMNAQVVAREEREWREALEERRRAAAREEREWQEALEERRRIAAEKAAREEREWREAQEERRREAAEKAAREERDWREARERKEEERRRADQLHQLELVKLQAELARLKSAAGHGTS